MRKAFIGLIDHREVLELQWLLPECQTARRWLLNIAEPHRAAGVWVVMDSSVATEIELLLAEGNGAEALRQMASSAGLHGAVTTREKQHWPVGLVMKALPPAFEISLASPSLDDVPEVCREVVSGLIASASHPDPVFRELIATHLAEWTEQVRLWSHGELVYESTEAWRTAYQAVLANPEVKEYRSVAWVKTEDYWQELPGQRALQFNYQLLDRGVKIERLLILGWNLWPPELTLPHSAIRGWVDEQHYRGIEVWLVRESDLVGERGLLSDFGIYGDNAAGNQELDDASRTVSFTLSFDRSAIQIARERWARLLLFATPYADLLDRDA